MMQVYAAKKIFLFEEFKNHFDAAAARDQCP